MKVARLAYGLLLFVWIALAHSNASAQTYEVMQERNGLINAFARLKAGQPLRVLFLGGATSSDVVSTDAANTWPAKTVSWLKRQYPRAVISVTGVNCSGSGAYGAAMLWPIVSACQPDLVFVDLADQDGEAVSQHSGEWVNSATEGLIRQIRTSNAAAEMCFIYGLRKEMLPAYKQGLLPGCIFQHDVAAAHYRICSVNAGASAAEQINTGKLTWAEFAGDAGSLTAAAHALYADTLTAFLAEQALHVGRGVIPYRMVSRLSAAAISSVRVQLPEGALSQGWSRVAEAPVAGATSVTLHAAAGAAAIKISFEGTFASPVIVTGKGLQSIEVKIDEGAWVRIVVPASGAASTGLWSATAGTGLKLGAHSLEIRPVGTSSLILAGVATAGVSEP